MDTFEEASAVLRAWKGDNDVSLFDKLGEELSHQEGEWPSASAAMDSLLRNRLADTSISGESKLLNDALNCNIDWEWRHRDVEGVDQRASPDGIPHAWQDGTERTQKTRAFVECPEESFQDRGSAPSRWQLLASYTEKGQLPPPQLLADSDHDLKYYNPSQYMEVVQSRPDQGGGFYRKTLASAAKHVHGEPPEARRAVDVKKYDPRPVMELRHQMVAEKRKKRALQKVDIVAQGRAALAEARDSVRPLVQMDDSSTSRASASARPERKDNRVLAFQKRKLAVQEEQQRLEAEVQRLREQIREDAETHRRARQEMQEIAGGERRDQRSAGMTAEEDANGPRLEGISPLGVLRETRNSNWQEKQGLPRPRSAGRPVTGQRYGDQNVAEMDGRERRGNPSERILGSTREERDLGCSRGGSGQGSRKGSVRVKSSAPATSSFLRADEKRTRDCVHEKVKELTRGMERSDGRPSLAAEAGDPDSREVPDGPSYEEPGVPAFKSGQHESLRRAESDHPGRANDERATDRGKRVSEDLPPNVGHLSDVRLGAGNAMGEGERSGEKHLSDSVNVSSTNSGKFFESGLYQGEMGNVEGAERVAEQRSVKDPKAAATGSGSSSPTEVTGKAEGVESADLATLARQQAEVAARKRHALEEAAAVALAAQQRQQAELLRAKELDTMLELLASTKERRALQRAWSTWRAEVVRARAPLQRAMIVLQWRRMTLLWRSWRHEVQKGKDERAKERLEAELRADALTWQRAVHHWRLRLLSQAFIVWQDVSGKERLKKGVQAQHAARSQKMRVLLSKQEALRLSLLWKDRKYRAGEIDVPSSNSLDARPVGEHGGNEPTNLRSRAGTGLGDGFDRGQERKNVSDDVFPVHVTEQWRDVYSGSGAKGDVVGEKREGDAEGSGEDGAEASEDGRSVRTRQAWVSPDIDNKESTESGREQRDSTGSANSPVGLVAAVRMESASKREDRQERLLRGICSPEESERTLSSQNEASSDRRKEGHGAGRRTAHPQRDATDGQRTFLPSESESWCDAGKLEGDKPECALRAMDESPGGSRREPGSGRQSAEPLGRESVAAAGDSDPVEKMAGRAAARRLKREELRKKYEEAQKRKQEEQEAGERLRLETERLEKAAALARRLEDARAKKQAEQAAVRQKELAAQQLMLAKVHYMRQVLLRWGWRPWRRLVDLGRSQTLASTAHHEFSLTRATWAAWQSFLREVQEEREQEERARLGLAEQHWKARAQERAWRWWRLVLGARKHGGQRRMTRALHCLREAVRAAREREGEAAELCARMLATRAWSGWHEVTEEGRDVRLLKEVADGARADRYAHRSLLRRKFLTWADAAEATKAEEEKQRREDAMWSKINGWLADHRKEKSSSATRESNFNGTDDISQQT